VVNAVLRDGVRERARHVLLAHELREPLWSILPRQDQIRHPPTLPQSRRPESS
jgi:hypothetical protein